MTLAFWEPFRELDQFDRVVGDLFGRDAWARAQAPRTRPLAADLAADKDGYVFRFEIPGVPKDAITISVEDNVLTVSGERTDAFSGDDSKTVYRREIVANSDFRKFDDGLKMTLDIEPERLAGIEARLQEARAAGVCRYGLHRQDSALMTCVVPTPLARDHVHFIDGAAGGYALAAAKLKAASKATVTDAY